MVACETVGARIVTIDGDAADASVSELGGRLRAAGEARPAEVVVLRAKAAHPRVLDREVAPPPKWEITVRPGGWERFDAVLSDTLAAAAVPGAVGIRLGGDWPSVTVETIEQFASVFTELSSQPPFRKGGTYTLQSLDKHLRIVHVPTRTTEQAILEIIGIAEDHPRAEVLLEAPTSGPQYPTLYVARLTPAEARELDARLSDPRLAKADVDGYALDYVLRFLSGSGAEYITGTFGSVPSR